MKMDGVINYLKKGISANNEAIAAYIDSIEIVGEKDPDDPILKMQTNAIAMLDDENGQLVKAIEILKRQNPGYSSL